MDDRTIGVIGAGFVGSAVARGFVLSGEMRIWDIVPEKCSHDFAVVVNSDFVFVCLPTPMEHAEGGKADLSIIENFFRDVNCCVCDNKDRIFIIKSTVPIGTTERLVKQFGLSIVHSPEFLTARAALIDFVTPARNIVGGEFPNERGIVAKLIEERFPGVPCYQMESRESEMVKYFANCFFAVKVSFFNEARLLSDKMGLNWDKVMEGVISDGRIAKSHIDVPGHDGDRGFGGTCVPADAKVKIKMTTQDELDNYNPEVHDPEVINIEELYKRFQDKDHSWGMDSFQIESCNFECTEQEWKSIEEMTCREIDEDIVVIETGQGEFRCTTDHLVPIVRYGAQLLVRAGDLKKSDEVFLKERESKMLKQDDYHHDCKVPAAQYMKTVKIKKISREHYEGPVFNLELYTWSDRDDLFWIEQDTGLVTHNCFPKDINALISTFEANGLEPLLLKAAWEQNKNVRSNWDWATNSSAVSNPDEIK